jgi:hypothetical protein
MSLSSEFSRQALTVIVLALTMGHGSGRPRLMNDRLTAKTSRNLAVGDENSQGGNLPRQISAAHSKRFVSGANGTTVRRDPRAEHEPGIQRTVYAASDQPYR